jgi:hypothetical protein
MSFSRSLLVLILACSALTACGGVRESLGLGRTPPDEFAVVDRPPLSMPPDFGLRPPVPGAPRPQEIDPGVRASETLFGAADKSVDKKPAVSGVERALLDQAGATKAPADIRATINNESAEKVDVSPHLVEELLWWKNDVKPGVTVDSAAEAERIKSAKDKGEPLNKSATPVIEQDKSGWLGL